MSPCRDEEHHHDEQDQDGEDRVGWDTGHVGDPSDDFVTGSLVVAETVDRHLFHDLGLVKLLRREHRRDV